MHAAPPLPTGSTVTGVVVAAGSTQPIELATVSLQKPDGTAVLATATNLEGRFALAKEVARYAAKHALSSVPRPPHWSGFRVQPLAIEFWRDRPFRLHERIRYHREAPGDSWKVDHLFP